jgi:hypothetical protein
LSTINIPNPIIRIKKNQIFIQIANPIKRINQNHFLSHVINPKKKRTPKNPPIQSPALMFVILLVTQVFLHASASLPAKPHSLQRRVTFNPPLFLLLYPPSLTKEGHQTIVQSTFFVIIFHLTPISPLTTQIVMKNAISRPSPHVFCCAPGTKGNENILTRKRGGLVKANSQ